MTVSSGTVALHVRACACVVEGVFVYINAMRYAGEVQGAGGEGGDVRDGGEVPGMPECDCRHARRQGGRRGKGGGRGAARVAAVRLHEEGKAATDAAVLPTRGDASARPPRVPCFLREAPPQLLPLTPLCSGMLSSARPAPSVERRVGKPRGARGGGPLEMRSRVGRRPRTPRRLRSSSEVTERVSASITGLVFLVDVLWPRAREGGRTRWAKARVCVWVFVWTGDAVRCDEVGDTTAEVKAARRRVRRVEEMSPPRLHRSRLTRTHTDTTTLAVTCPHTP